jgi:hypothetical protein
MNSPYNSGFENAPFIPSNQSFEEQRKGRLAESIDEYLNEGRANGDVESIDVFYQDLRDCIQDLIDYHGKRKDHAVAALEAVLGHRPIPELGDEFPRPQGNRL